MLYGVIEPNQKIFCIFDINKNFSMDANRIELIKDLIQNGKNSTWEDYAIEYELRDGKQANDYWRWHLNNPEYYAPGIPINTSGYIDNIEHSVKNVEVLEETDVENKYDHLTLKSAWETKTKDGIKVLRSWTNNVTGEDIEEFRENLIDEISKFSPNAPFKFKANPDGLLAEISFPDFHIGRIGVEESKELYAKIIAKTIHRLRHKHLDRIVYILGNDWLNVDTPDYKTTRGTQQKDVDDFSTTMRAGVNIALNSIYALKELGVPIDVIILPGNHDRFRMEAVGIALSGYFSGDSQVNIDDRRKFRKYYCFGNSAFMYEHGELKAKDYTAIFATEEKKLWASTEYHYVRCGHLHHNIEEEFVGTEVTFMPSLSQKSDWEDQKGYISHRRGFVYLHDREEGEVDRLQIKI